MCISKKHASEQTRKEKCLRMQEGRQVHAVREEESYQDSEQVIVFNVQIKQKDRYHDHEETMERNVHLVLNDILEHADQQNKTIERKRVKQQSKICIVS